MRPSNYIDDSKPQSSSNRRMMRERGTLRCLWCNKRTEVRPGFSWGGIEEDEWRSFVAENTPFYCGRETCRAHRSECGAPAQSGDSRQRRKG
jgi:hypothetical protein